MTERGQTADKLRKLDDSQVESFAADYVWPAMMTSVTELLARDIGDRFEFLDIGGGSGGFADRLLERYAGARGTVLDNSHLLIERNAPHPRKDTACCSAEHLADVLSGRAFDVIFYNLVLHHLVSGSFRSSLDSIAENLRMARGLLSSRGRISIIENVPVALLADRVPTRVIFELTSSRRLAPLVASAGANTAGVGVCYLTDRRWREMFAQVGLDVTDHREFPGCPLGRFAAAKNLLLHLRSAIPRVHYWCGPRRVPS